jgi:hypothetical protein
MKKDKIVSIEYIGELHTIDISVSNNNLFFANDILTHNCGFDTQDPDLTTISESIGLAATADFIASVFQQEGDNMNNRIRVGLMKNRWGTNSGTNVFGIDYTTLSIYEDESLNDEENEEVEEASRALNDGD